MSTLKIPKKVVIDIDNAFTPAVISSVAFLQRIANMNGVQFEIIHTDDVTNKACEVLEDISIFYSSTNEYEIPDRDFYSISYVSRNSKAGFFTETVTTYADFCELKNDPIGIKMFLESFAIPIDEDTRFERPTALKTFLGCLKPSENSNDTTKRSAFSKAVKIAKEMINQVMASIYNAEKYTELVDHAMEKQTEVDKTLGILWLPCEIPSRYLLDKEINYALIEYQHASGTAYTIVFALGYNAITDSLLMGYPYVINSNSKVVVFGAAVYAYTAIKRMIANKYAHLPKLVNSLTMYGKKVI